MIMSPQQQESQSHEPEANAAVLVTEESTATEASSKGPTRTIPLVELALENVTYAPMTSTAKGGGKSNKSRKVVLDQVSTKVSPFQLSAWMGPSGSGKTSLISVAAGLTRPGDILEGSLIKVNDEEGIVPKRLVGVVWQDDLLLSNLTVEEIIYFAAKLKTPSETPDVASAEGGGRDHG